MSWDDFKRMEKESGSFIRIKDGQFIEGVFVGEPYCFYSKFGDKAEYKTNVSGTGKRFKYVFAVKEAGGWEKRIFEGTITTLRSIKAVLDEYGQDCIFKIKREGSTKDDTKYHILFKANLDEEELELIKKVKSPTLMRNANPNEGEGSQEGSGDDIPF